VRCGSTQCGNDAVRSHVHSPQQGMALAGRCVLQRGNGRVERGMHLIYTVKRARHKRFAQDLMSRDARVTAPAVSVLPLRHFRSESGRSLAACSAAGDLHVVRN
jgi:hypothetical protein